MKTKLLNLFRKIFQHPKLEHWLRNKISTNPEHLFFSKLAPNNYQYKEGSLRTFKHINNTILQVDISDYVGHYLYFGFKDEGHESLYNLIKTGDTVLDIGTNIGSTLLVMASIVKEPGDVYGFEPDQLNYKNCMNNIKLNTFDNVTVSAMGLGQEKGSFDLIVDTISNRGGNRISYNTDQKQSTKIEVDTLDNWIQDNKIKHVNVIKIDVEGFEYKVLKGGEQLLTEEQPTLFIELDDTNLKAVGDSASKLVALLEEWNYNVLHAVTKEALKSSDDFTGCHYDIIAKAK